MTLVWLVPLLLGASPSAPAAALARVDPAAAASAPVLGLPADASAMAAQYAEAAEKVRVGGTDADVCALVTRADALGGNLAEPMNRAWEAIGHHYKDETNPTDAETAAVISETDAFNAAREKLLAAIPGVDVSIYANGNRGGIGYGAMAKLVKAKHAAAAALLTGAGELLDGKVAAYVTMKTDDQGCVDYAPAQDAIARIARSWTAAPACLKNALKEPLTIAVDGAGDQTGCWCPKKDAATVSAKKFADSLGPLHDLDGPAAAAKIRKAIAAPGAKFDCKPD